MKIFYIFLFLTNIITAQGFLYQGNIGNFNNAVSFSLSNLNYFYICDKNSGDIVKIDTSGEIIKSIGGYGSDNYSFDSPVDVYFSTLKLLVTDKNNNRILIYDKDLNYISEIDGKKNNPNEETEFGYPLSSIVSSQGDIFILDSENKRILKLNSAGEFLLSFGDYNSGEFSLSSPKGMAFLEDRFIAVLDKSRLVLFDLFGNGLTGFTLEDNIIGIRSFKGSLFINTTDKLYQVEYPEERVMLKEISFEKAGIGNIIEAIILNDTLYILTKEKINVFKNKKG